MKIDLTDDMIRRRAEIAVTSFNHDKAADPDLAEKFYGGEDQMLRQYLNDCGFPGITTTQARTVLNGLDVPDTGTERPVCADCRHPLHQQEEQALSGEFALVWADEVGLWTCPKTGDEHRPEGQPEHEPEPAPHKFIDIQPLTEILGSDTGYRVVCRECGDVTREESGFTVNAEEATVQQAGLYRQRHLARHLAALSAEVSEAAR